MPFERKRLLAALIALIVAFATGPHDAGAMNREHARTPSRAIGAAGTNFRFRPVLMREARSRSLCESQPDRLFVAHHRGSACIAYFITAGEAALTRAVVFMDGDVPASRYDKLGSRPQEAEAVLHGQLAERRTWLQAIAERHGVRIIQLSRLGVEGSSGNHADRRKPDELYAMSAAIDALKERFGLVDVVLAGQSGGATLAASMLTLGRRDVACAVLGSGAYELAALVHESILDDGRRRDISEHDVASVVYDPSRKVAGIARDDRRRVILLADRNDARTPFGQQRRFAAHMREIGHHARLFAIEATGALSHGATVYTLPLAAMCAAGASDDAMRDVVETIRGRLQQSTPRPIPATHGATTPDED